MCWRLKIRTGRAREHEKLQIIFREVAVELATFRDLYVPGKILSADFQLVGQLLCGVQLALIISNRVLHKLTKSSTVLCKTQTLQSPAHLERGLISMASTR